MIPQGFFHSDLATTRVEYFVFVPFILMASALSLKKTPPPVHVGLAILFLVSAMTSWGTGSEGFMPRQDFKGVAHTLKGEEPLRLMVAPAWDAEGVAYYTGDASPIPVMAADDIARQAAQGEPLAVLLARPERHPLDNGDIEAALGSNWRLVESRLFRGHRGFMRWLKYDDVSASESKRD